MLSDSQTWLWATAFPGELKTSSPSAPFGSGPRKLYFWTLPGESAVQTGFVASGMDSRGEKNTQARKISKWQGSFGAWTL